MLYIFIWCLTELSKIPIVTDNDWALGTDQADWYIIFMCIIWSYAGYSKILIGGVELKWQQN